MVGGLLALLFLLPPVAFTIFLVFFSMVASIELQQMLCADRARGGLFLTAGATTFAAFAPALLSLPSGAPFSLEHALLIASALIVAGSLFAGASDLRERLQRLMGDLFGLLYLSLTLPSILELYQRDTTHGAFFLLALLITAGGDTGGYFAGRAFGRRKLAPLLSPKKTWEGYFGGLLLGGAAAAVAIHQFPACASLGWSDIALLSVVGVSLGVLGDLFESLIKRGVGAKDSGTLIPGHGGVLDRVDGLLFVAPFVLAYLEFVAPLTSGLPS